VACGAAERFAGGDLLQALADAGLEHGRFSIFHRTGPGGETLFSVASLVEPGTFDLRVAESQEFPGVSFFAVLRQPAEALEVFDEMLNTARLFAQQLRGTLQDERGVPLHMQGLAALREEVVAWQAATMRQAAN
jgi:cell division protein ZipA